MTYSHMHIDCDSALVELQVILFYFIFYQLLIFFLNWCKATSHATMLMLWPVFCKFVFLKFPIKIHDVQDTMSNMAKLLWAKRVAYREIKVRKGFKKYPQSPHIPLYTVAKLQEERVELEL